MTQAEYTHPGKAAGTEVPPPKSGGASRRRPTKRLTPRQKKIRKTRMQITNRFHKATEISLLALLISGLMVTEYTEVPWDIKRWALNAHIVAALVLFPLVIAVFWAAHRGNLGWSRRSQQRKTGHFIEYGLVVMFLCGLWLLFIGENKTQIGEVAHVIHLATAVPLVLLILWHSWRFSLTKKLLPVLGILGIAFLVLAASPVRSAAQTTDALAEHIAQVRQEAERIASRAAQEAGEIGSELAGEAQRIGAELADEAAKIEAEAKPFLNDLALKIAARSTELYDQAKSWATGKAPAAAQVPASTPPTVVQTSGSLKMSQDKTLIYSANFEGGSVSKVDRKTGEKLAETLLGKEIRTVALSNDQTLLAATDHTGDAFHILDADTMEVQHSHPLPGQPYGVVHDGRNRVFWVTTSRSADLYAISERGRILRRIPVAETPRGLALLPDGRLFMTHALIGTVSIYDTTTPAMTLLKTIKLKETQNPDQTVSQGLPRVLDTFAFSPDLKQAWLPHHLWNFDHPFQFQSIVFPVFSVLWTEAGQEHEVVNRRKQILQQINIVDVGNIQRIVSNPYDATFSDDGEKVYATLAGSEDLVVFDLTRAPPITGTEGPEGSSGANASAIMALPGQNPRGIQMDGEDIYIQNAMSMDLTSISTGGGGPFAQMAVSNPSFAKLVANDPLEPKLRRGLRLFHLAKTAALPDTPMAGDNWMSCASCHLDGFNYTNSSLFQSTPLDLEKDAVPGHFSLQSFITGDFVAEYIRMIRQTQGGMGFDTRFPTPNTDPENPSTQAKSMMEDLHYYVTSPDNLPLLSTWLQGDNGTGAVDHTQWVNSAVCGNCHTRIFEEWAGSMHHRNGVSNPYYMVLENLAAENVGEEFRVWCMGCHTPQALLSGERKTAGVSRLFEKNGEDLRAELETHLHTIDEGLSCVFCHRTEDVQRIATTGGGNASMSIELANRQTYPGEMSTNPIARWVADRAIRAEPEEHIASFKPAVLSDPVFCSTCHNEFTPAVGAVTTSTYTEWLASPYANPDGETEYTTCMDCHMHADIEKIGTPIPGQVTDGGPVKPDYASHYMPGGQYFLVGLRDPKRREMSEQLLKRASKIEASVRAADSGGDELVVRVSNVGAGHNLPTGVADFRQLWLRVIVTDGNGTTLLSSGTLDDKGHLDPEARIFNDVFEDGSGHMLGLEFWNYRRSAKDTRIPPKGHRDEVFVLPADAKPPFEIDVKLMFRVFPQAVTDLVRKEYPEMPNPEALELHHISRSIGGT